MRRDHLHFWKVREDLLAVSLGRVSSSSLFPFFLLTTPKLSSILIHKYIATSYKIISPSEFDFIMAAAATEKSFDIPKTYRACVYDKPGTISTKIEELETPEPGAGEVLVRL
jgi:hypothetical protein